ncbi:unnamed protein product [Pieris macdunnoughi]|uniref:Centriolar coiled-coil protein of 110 kDa n=1 Tax=Pieris macdunnoughi TaxID=345717 RepID=A0A821WU95_9NEOP|nr:unnamed protein product [Pieris macdunnoughi]
MNDPWDVKCVRQSGQYVSCIKLNGVPLLPPVLSKECRKEMQYYKLLAIEVEKRIQALKKFLLESDDTESAEDKTDAPERPESEQNDNSPNDKKDFNSNSIITKDLERSTLQVETPVTELESLSKTPSKFTIDLSLSINEKYGFQDTNSIEVPVRDCECSNEMANNESKIDSSKEVEDKIVFSVSVKKEELTEPLSNHLYEDDPPSLTAKSFTGSLNNIHTDSKGYESIPLSRQRSYTILTPSPMLLAHLEVQSLNTGVEINSISMSESTSNLYSPNKKRRSWDLESAKVKWSSMALELKQKNIDIASKNQKAITKPAKKTPPSASTHLRARSLARESTKRITNTYNTPNKSEPITKPKKSQSPVRNTTMIGKISKTPVMNVNPKEIEKKQTSPKPPVSESEDPATRVRELYEKIQKQQLAQMATLVEKQKKEQMLLQQVFEEQNNMLYNQLQTICPKPPNNVKEAWVEKSDRGPVSLNQLINHKRSDSCESPVQSTITDTNTYLNRCDNVLKKSRDITSSINKGKVSQVNEKSPPKPTQSVKRSQSPVRRNGTSRKLTYDTSSDREYELILTDRTNDTMADLNVTFPSDNSDECPYTPPKNTKTNRKNVSPTAMPLAEPCKSTDRAIKSMEETIHNSIKSMCSRRAPSVCRQTTPQERAAATKIVAYAKGFLVRRLMRTERVQGTVQTIKDALLCALQLHQDREGIRGADVDLHRRLIQQITAACYSLHDTFITSTAAERCAMINADRGRRRSLANRPPIRQHRPTDLMSQSHCGAFPARSKRSTNASLMTQSNYETFSGDKSSVRHYMPSPRRRPWR